MKPKVKKLSKGTYEVTFSKNQSYVVTIPLFWVKLQDEKMCRSVAIEVASEQLPKV